MKQLLEDYKGDVKVVMKHLIVHPQVATIPAEAACAAHKQGKFWEMEDGIWVKGFRANRNLGQDNMEKIAAEIGLNMDQFKKDMAGECKQIVAKDQADLRKVGAGGTPGFFINGRFLSGARPIDHFKQLVDEELKKANERIAKGTKVEDYYNEWVLKKGKQSL
jgi:protein-disulfide isomerase